MTDNDLFVRAIEERDAGNTQKAFELFSKAAADGHAAAQNSLGYLYDHGIGVAKDPTKALFWYRKAALNGDVLGCHNLAITYRDVGKVRQAKLWFEKAVAKDDGDAALELAKLFLRGTKRNLKQARKYLNIAVKSNYILSDSKEEARKLLDELGSE
jgi:TPR repeat protein